MMWIFGLLAACGGSATGPAGAAELANAIAKEPARADAILKEYGTTRAAFEAQLYDIAEDPALTDAYLAARH